MAKRRASKAFSSRKLNARPDTIDFRDRMFVPTLVEVPTHIDLANYRKVGVPILDQGSEGACTGFGLATVANYLLRTRKVVSDHVQVSARMMYEIARRYDEWAGENYDGSSARGAMKGWHKHGVCSEQLWKSDPKKKPPKSVLTLERAANASTRPLGAYFRVNHKDLVAMHAAMSEVGILYASATVHTGWDNVGKDGRIPYELEEAGGHAFALVAYDGEGFWLQNSWADDWGFHGFAHITYDDWLQNGSDVWVARLGVPVQLHKIESAALANAKASSMALGYSFHDLRPHIVSVGNNGQFREEGTYGTSAAEVKSILSNDFPDTTNGWNEKRLVLYAHGGLTSEEAAVQRVADYRKPMLDSKLYPLAFIWKTDIWTTITNILHDALGQRRSEGALGAAKEFMLDRLDGALEPVARLLGGKKIWDEMKENAVDATQAAAGAAATTGKYLAEAIKNDPQIELHVVGHSAGAIFHAPLVQLLATNGKIAQGPMKGKSGLGLTIKSCTLWAPACTVDLFKQTYVPVIESGGIERFALFTLTDKAELDDHCANIYHKSLLYLVSNAFEKRPRVPFATDGEPILGMQKFVDDNADLQKLFKRKTCEWILAPNTAADGSPNRSTSQHHGDFDDDLPTLQATMARILGAKTSHAVATFQRGPNSLSDQRKRIQIADLSPRATSMSLPTG